MDYLHALLNLPAVAGPAVSPNRRWVAWTWLNVGPTADVYLSPCDGSAPPSRLTNTGENTWINSWLADSSGLVISHDHNGNEKDQLFLLRLDEPEKLKPLTEKNPPYYIRGGKLHPHEPWLFYSANYDFKSKRLLEPAWLYRHNVQTGEKKVLARPKKPGAYAPKLNIQGSYILYPRSDRDPAGEQIWLVDIDGRQDREIINLGDKTKVRASWCPDGQTAVVVAEAENYRRLGLWSLKTDRLEWLIDDPDRNIEYAYMPLGAEQIVVEEIKQARSIFSLLNPRTLEETPFLNAGGGTFTPLAPLADGRWLGISYSSTQPRDLVVSAPGQLVSLTNVLAKAGISKDQLVPAEDFWWQSADGRKIQGWLYRTPYQPKGTIICAHGGPSAHSEDALDPETQYYLSVGFNVLDPNYRGSTGFDLDFQEAIKKDGWGGAEQEDIASGIRALIDAGIAKAGKVGITGTSYGGYSAWHAITHFPLDIISAAAPVCGMTDLIIDYETTRPDLRPYSEEMMGGKPVDLPEKYKQRSPINFVSNIKGQLMIVQGLNDPNVTPANVKEVETALKAGGIKYQKLLFKDEGHGIAKPKNKLTLYKKLAEFFEQAFAGE
ncbi:MAG TPA: prolyl oligopeptidase family serine peptidase [Candidatus Saccharimonadales bacterium]|nr:prolyl oligopeptidase family serine peptidase [Candidatus Saccharimonadales bacterium]